MWNYQKYNEKKIRPRLMYLYVLTIKKSRHEAIAFCIANILIATGFRNNSL